MINYISQYFSEIEDNNNRSNHKALFTKEIGYIREHMVNPQIEVKKQKIIQNGEYKSNRDCIPNLIIQR